MVSTRTCGVLNITILIQHLWPDLLLPPTLIEDTLAMSTFTAESKITLDTAARNLREASVLIADGLAFRLRLSCNPLQQDTDFHPDEIRTIRDDLVCVNIYHIRPAG